MRQRGYDLLGVDDVGEFGAQRRQVRALDVIGRDRAAGAIGQVEAAAGIAEPI